jgi:hypothetical protein
MGIEQEGSLSFRLGHQDKDWATNAKPYEFPPLQSGPITVQVYKHPTKRIEIRVRGPLNAELVFDGTLPPVREDGLNIAITWNPKQVRLYFDGRLTKSVDFPQPPGNGGNGGAPGAASAPDEGD